ncbi:lipopolysaccharide biosynthesis protein [Geofilum rubicundum]|uniref:Polysaccharide biosynthesis protein n=1 Tax=Geofilum rubicundum JCM 15548 TaxID=1236989 RepID=A0A0E9M2E4_9BACT|nr:oligosaccharide flippase family protein [Geofilum rubicundum]GAO31300.1 polysaccharide biosynthesis protein [Geofilum rubicundum JCM 15548]
MSLSLKQLAGDTVIYGASTMVGRLLNWLLMPFYIRVIAPEEYGVIVNMYGIISILLVIFTYGLETGFFRFARKENARDVFRTTMSTLGLTSFLLIVLSFVFAPSISRFFYDGQFVYAIVLVGIIIGFDAFLSIPFAQLRLQNRALRFGLIKLISIFLNIGFNLFFFLGLPALFNAYEFGEVLQDLYIKGSGVLYVLLSNALSSVLILLFFIKDLRIKTGRFRWSLLRPILIYSWPVLIVGITGMITQNSDKILMPKLLQEGGFKELAIYGANFKIGVLMSLFTQSFRFAFEPYFFNNREKGVQTYALIMEYFILFGLLIFVGITLFQDVINLLLVNDYIRGNIIIPVVLLAQLFYGIYFNLSLWYKLTDKTFFGAIFGVIGMVLTVVLNFVLIPKIGMIGGALSMLTGYGVMMMISFYTGQKFYPIPYPLKRIAAFFILAFGAFLLNQFVSFDQLFLKYTFKVLIFICFPFILLRLRSYI